MPTFRFICLLSLLTLLEAPAALAQTAVNLATQSRSADFSAFPSTRPVKTGTTLPASCVIGDLFFKTDATPGANLFACVASNIWQVVGSTLPSQNQAIQRVLVSDGINGNWVLLGGDVSGTPDALTVNRIANRPVLSAAPSTGQALIWNGTSWAPGSTPNGTVGVALEGTTLANRGLINFIGGAGLLTSLTDTGSRVDVQQSIDTAVMLTRAEYRSGSALLCNSTSNNPVDYTCSLSFPLSSYQTNMVLYWKPDVSATGGPTTLQIGSLPAVPVTLANGIDAPAAVNIEANQIYPIWYDGTSFRLIGVSNPLPDQGLIADRPTCSASTRGRRWFAVSPDGTSDSFAVCAKDASDTYDWRTIY